MHRGIIIPVEPYEGKLNREEILSLRVRASKDDDGKIWFPVFTSDKEVEKGDQSSVVPIHLIKAMKMAKNGEEFSGMVVNAWGKKMRIPKDLIERMLDVAEKNL